jgi:DNA repair protein RadD
MNRDRNCIYKSINDVVQISEVVEQGYWSKLVYDIKDVDETDLELNTTGSDYTDKSIEKFKETNDINNRIISEVNNLISEGRKSILVSVPFISDAEEIAANISCSKALFSGMDNKDRDSIINDFKSLKLKVIIQCKILTIGFDHPQLDAIVIAKPSNSLTFHYQLVGRGVRVHKDKKDCKIVDLSGNCNKFGNVETISIENEKLTKGWAVFNGDMLLSNYPLNTTNRPTKKSLQVKLDWEIESTKDSSSDLTFYFGKYKDKKISEVMKENKSYLTWLLDQKDFNWYGDRGTKLKECIEKNLGVFVQKYKINSVTTSKEVLNNYTNSIKTISDLDNIW